MIKKYMRNVDIAEGEYYHIFGRGNNKQNVFVGDADYIRFLFLIFHFQSPKNFENIGRFVKYFVKHGVFNIDRDVIEDIMRDRFVELAAFSLMPNHYHLLVRAIEDDGIAKYMQRVLNSFTKYFNTKHKRSGHLFQGPYGAKHVENNKQLLHLSAYIHKNPTELHDWQNAEIKYPWSSYQDLVVDNRWGSLLFSEIILNQFSNKGEYHNFVRNSGVKEMDDC
ncbi:MAG: hypothetical protein A2835_00380 [Candidatus Niyogibacteria bacterium RIFCSPHIGHO2_01_FULL_45_28]|uniref:Transposase IS200-like domain-containing protein n=3 Tax=Parcubacteria group TaxID=1794811 RepID=A0A1G2EX91_9BACT|nr:MAG: hypothetical protein A2835_00380 [Candidatus Niyogibacteria bacterium RIFCSPHIGHO2_01_FULL_45_28]OGZ30363.1 MAG: hypothetical protein A3J00_02835 [Candidatus Niyogibacteria bacterium RIFCSPLOWO2_02_FULL_45_13]OHA68011.1 MAG: hypothetical protein A3D59_00135 [Candidatus Wildermuthbacteria bacterium RIFCSPHIGHO2_02_FULL_47_17]